jgi:hypothetical protein
VRLLPYDKFTKIFRRRSMYCHWVGSDR